MWLFHSSAKLFTSCGAIIEPSYGVSYASKTEMHPEFSEILSDATHQAVYSRKKPALGTPKHFLVHVGKLSFNCIIIIYFIYKNSSTESMNNKLLSLFPV